MKVLVFVVIVALGAGSDDPLKAVLSSPAASLQAYSAYKRNMGVQYRTTEDRMRFKLWKQSAQIVAAENSRDGHSATLALNFFSVMTQEESRRYLGLNKTLAISQSDVPRFELKNSLASVPEAKDWTKDDLVTAVKNQASCGSCWTFGAVGGLETRYALLENGVGDGVGVLRNFAEKEWLDCVYPDRNGCQGGWMHDCYTYSKSVGGRLAATADYPYEPIDEECKSDVTPDAMLAAKIGGYVQVGRTEEDNVAAIAEGSITVAFEVTAFFQLYSSGIIRDMTCTGMTNHAVTAVGYTQKYILVKNSWGKDWGDNGFVRYMRGHHNCGLYLESFYPILTLTGATDGTAADTATDYVVPDNDDEADPYICLDKYQKCTADHCKNVVFAENYCEKTCDKCKDSDGCPPGTIKCDNGECRHKHMC